MRWAKLLKNPEAALKDSQQYDLKRHGSTSVATCAPSPAAQLRWESRHDPVLLGCGLAAAVESYPLGHPQ